VYNYRTLCGRKPIDARWIAEFSGDIRPQLEALLSRLGYKESDRVTKLSPRRYPPGTLLHNWERGPNLSSVGLTPYDNKVQIIYDPPQGAK
jgi:hypothetical protein